MVDELTQISDRDEALIRLLQANARESVSNLARVLGVSRTAVQERLNRLKRLGVIEGFTVKLNPDWNRSHVTTFIELVIEPKCVTPIMATIERMPSVKALWSISGRFDLLAEATATTTEDIDKLLLDLGDIEGVIRTESHVALSTKFDRR
jgi:DNA-binding Lrp family transcriptional regulator